MEGIYLDFAGLLKASKSLMNLVKGLQDTTELHKWFVIEAQDLALDTYPTAPELSALTRNARRGGSTKVLFRTGRLWNSITGGKGVGASGISTDPDTLNIATRDWARLGSNLIYAGVHHRGDTITAKRAKFLTIPMSKEATAAGSIRKFKKPLDLLRLKNRPGYIKVEKLSKTAKKKLKKGVPRPHTKAHWLLVQSVQIPQRSPGRGILPTIQELEPLMLDTTIRWVTHKIKKLKGV